jgi:hypothetical protein
LKKTEKDITVRPSEPYEESIRSKCPEKNYFFSVLIQKNDDRLIWACAIKLKKSRFFC